LGLIAADYPLSQSIFQNWDALSEEQKVEEDLKMAVYGAMIDRLAQNIGRWISKLDEM